MVYCPLIYHNLWFLLIARNNYQKKVLESFVIIFKWKNKQPINIIFLNVRSIIQSKFMFFDCVFITDLHLFHETVLLNPCFKRSKNLMLSFICCFIFICCNRRLICSGFRCSCSLYFRNYAIHWPWIIKHYFTVNERQLKRSTKITQSNILMKQLLCLIYYHELVTSLLFLSYTQKI